MRVVARLLRRLVVLGTVAAVACAAAPAADDARPIAAGVLVGDVAVGGLTREPARALVAREAIRPLRIAHRAGGWRLDPRRLGAAVDPDEAVRAALGARADTDVALDVAVDAARVRAYVDRIASRYEVAPRDAELVGLDERLRPRFAPARAGARLDRGEAARLLASAIASRDAGPLRLPVERVPAAKRARDVGPIVVIRRESNRLQLWDGPKLVRAFSVATGTWEFPTPLGRFSIVDKQYHPWWYPPASEWAEGLEPIPPGPGNPLGTRWMGLDVYGVGIHGTPDAASIGYSASHGCIRMLVSEAEWLFERVDHGTPVFIVSA